jgi:anti-sigma regulatory factor (Ser/Thr protein kinase)
MPSLQFEFTCDLVQVPSAGQKLHSFLAANGCSQTEAADCELALVEACNNAIQHARPEQRREPVRVQALCATKQIELRIIDHTAGFDWPDQARLPDVDRETAAAFSPSNLSWTLRSPFRRLAKIPSSCAKPARKSDSCSVLCSLSWVLCPLSSSLGLPGRGFRAKAGLLGNF